VRESPVPGVGDVHQPVAGSALVEHHRAVVVDGDADAELDPGGCGQVRAASVVGVHVGQRGFVVDGLPAPPQLVLDGGVGDRFDWFDDGPQLLGGAAPFYADRARRPVETPPGDRG
jgi:hypothetical protein